MKFTGDLCRRLLLGLGAEEPAEETRVQDGNSDLDLTDRRQHGGSSQERLASEEGLDEEERTRRRAERRRAKKRRQKERRKQERDERMEDGAGQEEVEEGLAAASQSDRKEQLGWTARSPQSLPAHQRAQSGGNCRQPDDACNEEPEWDVSSAFVAKVANHIRLRGQVGGATVSNSREDEENECSGSQGAEVKRRGEALTGDSYLQHPQAFHFSTCSAGRFYFKSDRTDCALTAKGIQLFGKSCYSHALAMFTEAIHCDPEDHRFYGNRSFCYLCLEQHQPALADALRSIQLAPDWPKGYFRKGCALMALKRYPEAEQAFEHVLELDPRCKEARIKLLRCRLLQLMALGLDEEQSKDLLEKFTTVQAAGAAAEIGALRPPSLQDQSSCCSLWVGNVTVELTKDDLWDLFQTFGEIKSIRVMHERFCAFVNFENASMAASALEMLKGVEIRGTRLVMRYPENWTQHTPLATKRQSQSVDETP